MLRTKILTDTEWQEFVKEHSDEPCCRLGCERPAFWQVTAATCGCTKGVCAICFLRLHEFERERLVETPNRKIVVQILQ